MHQVYQKFCRCSACLYVQPNHNILSTDKSAGRNDDSLMRDMRGEEEEPTIDANIFMASLWLMIGKEMKELDGTHAGLTRMMVSRPLSATQSISR